MSMLRAGLLAGGAAAAYYGLKKSDKQEGTAPTEAPAEELGSSAITRKLQKKGYLPDLGGTPGMKMLDELNKQKD